MYMAKTAILQFEHQHRCVGQWKQIMAVGEKLTKPDLCLTLIIYSELDFHFNEWVSNHILTVI